ncbi:Hemolysin-type calcium-binding region domain protein OS=Rhodopirellula maiorica SM1 GN=RMSM_03614 PE=4 SV=1: VCBS [Tuwongella immobilis]|uniref:Uncharacterized protein n=1 Tax=Tuwongella immobilis TaxID=692036 RepID=A0A6C2YU40_9BACT|nr:Hemolysin-type calcium-binding region domain protein OS=Rhodopirellula maiorica SM1 GN=RMSM_03614 PE=4 SV=1: VCBS [Tuwongella immobilis]VTS07872.1 Hemolysin-type calcium-binding region domain protein OS=Rhodopirellula maiorica SM1 GN=RMSM_03614 PE=4 SV=1: VCBS [Tuwongella immobilis]
MLDQVHSDIGVNFVSNAWNLSVNDEDNNATFTAPNALLYADAASKQNRPADSKWDFLGVSSGQPIYILPQTQNASLLYLGASGEDTNPSDLAAYNETDPRVNSNGRWIKVAVQAIRGPGAFSVYSLDSGGNPTVWIDSADGITAEDAMFLPVGGHLHYNWAFSAKGIYEVDVIASSYRGANQTNPTSSNVTTYFFSVDPPAPVNTVPNGQTVPVNGTLAFSGANAISITGPNTTPKPLQVTLDVTAGSLTFGSLGGITIDEGSQGSSRIVVSGLPAQLNSALATLQYAPPADTNGTATLTVTTSDRGYFRPSRLPAQTDTDPISITISGTVPPGVPPVSPPGVPPVSPPGVPPVSPPGVPPVSPPNLPPLPNTGTIFGPPTRNHLMVSAADAGGGPHVRVYDATTGNEIANFMAFSPSFMGGVRIALGDFNGDGMTDIVAAAGPGGGPHVRIFDGVTFQEIASFFAYAPSFTGGVNLAVGDVNGNGTFDLITAAGPGGGPHVRVFDGPRLQPVLDFMAYDPSFSGGVSISAADINNDRRADIITAPFSQGGPHIRVFDGISGRDIVNFLASVSTTASGFTVAGLDLDGDFRAEIAIGTGPNGGGAVRIFNGQTGTLVSTELPFGLSAVGGVRVAATDTNGDGQYELVASRGPGDAPLTRIWSIADNVTTRELRPFDSAFLGGVWIAGN